MPSAAAAPPPRSSSRKTAADSRKRGNPTHASCAVKYGSETPPPGKVEDCDLVLVQDPDRLRRVLKEAGLDDRSIAVKVVLPDKVRMVVCWFDANKPATSAAQIAEVAVALRRDDESVRLRMELVDSAHRARIVLAVAKAAYDGYASRKRKDRVAYKKITFFGAGTADAGRHLERVCQGTALAADIENAPGNEVGPSDLARATIAWQPRDVAHVRARTLDAAELARLGMGLVLGVGRGAERPPCVALLELRGGADRGGGKKDNRRPVVALIGKGITYDTGGLSIKTLDGMLGMHGDKSGAAIAAAVFRHLATMPSPPPFDVIAVLPCAENAVSDRAVRPGDVLTACDGTTVEIVNPDAEGRLVLADALAFAGRAFEPDYAIDFATMTGTGLLVHPDVTAVIYATDDALSDVAQEAGEACGERVWRMPPWSEYGYETDSHVADSRNSGWSTMADGYMASLFLKRFVPKSCGENAERWLHVDVSKNEATGPRQGRGSGPFVGSGVALGVAFVNGLRALWGKKGGA
jgi:leucyl aminopeptidase